MKPHLYTVLSCAVGVIIGSLVHSAVPWHAIPVQAQTTTFIPTQVSSQLTSTGGSIAWYAGSNGGQLCIANSVGTTIQCHSVKFAAP